VISDLRFLALLGCFLLSGVSALVYETAWTQELTLVFGTSEMAVATVLAAYMAGLTLGAAAGGRWSSRVARPVLAYAFLEAGVALSALAVPAAVAVAGRLNVALLGGGELPPAADAPASIAFHLVTSFAILLVPTALMGATLPLLTRHAVDAEENLGPRVGVLYAANTVGAAGGVVLAAFLLLPRMGLDGALWVAVGLNALVFLLAALLARGARPPAPAAASPGASGKGAWVLPLIAASGVVSFTLEVLWSRLLTHVVGGSIYAFGTMLATFLVGIAAGSALAARVATTRERARRGFAVAQLLVAGSSVAAFLLVDRVAERWSAQAVGGALWEGVWLCAATILPSTLAIGATFPLAVRVLAGSADEASPATARVYAWNTIGAVVGALGAGLVWLPALRFAGTMTAAAAGALALAVIAAGLRPRLPRIAAVGLAGLVALALAPPPTPWRVLRTSALASAAPRPAEDPDGDDEVEIGGSVVYYGVGRGATVLLREQGAEWRLTTNGLPESVIQPPGSRPSRFALSHWMSLLPLALRPGTRSLLVVGLGGGGTAEDLPPVIQDVQVVELEPEVVAANRFLSRRRRVDPLANPRVRLHVDDARSALQLSSRSYDAIVSQPSHPWTGGSSNLFTREFYDLAERRLAPGGVFVQWIGFAFVDEALFRTLLATLRTVFPHVEVYQPPMTGAALLVASKWPFDVAATAPEGIAAAAGPWASLGVLRPEDLLAARVLDSDGSASLAEGAAVTTDRMNLFQTRAPRVLARPLTTAAADRAFAAVDAVRDLPEGVDALRVLRRLLDHGALPRALRLATALRDGQARRVAFALVDLASGHPERGRGALLALMANRETGAGALLADLEETPDTTEAPFALLLSLRLAALRPGAPPALSGWAQRDPLASALLEGWRSVAEDRGRAVEDLEPQLAQVSPGHPAYGAATRLRIQWRLASGEPARAREAIVLLDPLIATRPGSGDLLLRARLGAAAGDPDLVRVTLYEIVPSLERRAGQEATAEQALRILDSAAGGDPEARKLLRARLAAAAQPQVSAGAVTPGLQSPPASGSR
jgi:spermidine synthase